MKMLSMLSGYKLKKPSMLSLKGLKSNVGVSGLMSAAMCLPDFWSVPGAFTMKYDTDGKPVDGINWKSGLKEAAKSAIKCAGYIAIPSVIIGAAAAAGPVVAGLAFAGSFGSSMVLGSIFDKFLPEEQKLVADACKQKGINYNQLA